MVPVVDQEIAQDAVWAERPQLGGAVDQDAAVPRRHAAIGVLERGLAALGKPVQVPGQPIIVDRPRRSAPTAPAAGPGGNGPRRTRAAWRSRRGSEPWPARARTRTSGPPASLGRTTGAPPAKPTPARPSGSARIPTGCRRGSTSTGTVPIRSHQETMASSRRPNSSRIRSDSACRTIGGSIGPRWTIFGGAISRYLPNASDNHPEQGRTQSDLASRA